jgi:hypothetical protein
MEEEELAVARMLDSALDLLRSLRGGAWGQ